MNFTVTASEPVTVDTTGGTPRLQLTIGTLTRYATFASGSGTAALTFTYTAQPGDIDLDGITVVSPLQLNGGTIRDTGGNAVSPLTFSVPATPNVKVDYPSISMDFLADTYKLMGTAYTGLSSFLTGAGGTFSRNRPATYYDAAGFLQTAAIDVPRFDHDPITHAPKGILIEETRVNLALRSKSYNNAVWNRSGIASTNNAMVAPSGVLEADKLSPTTGNISHGMQQTGLIAVNTKYSLSFYAKAGEETTLIVENSGTGSAICNLSAGTITNTDLPGGSQLWSQNVGNGWYRYYATFTSGAAAGSDVTFYIRQKTAFAGNGTDGLYLWGVQLEQAPFPTSFIATTGSTSTRVADNLTFPTGTWYNAATSTMAVSGALPYIGSGVFPGFAAIDDNTANNAANFILNLSDQPKFEIFSGGSTAFAQTGTVYSPNSTAKMAMTYALNSGISALNGTLGTAETTLALPAAGTVLRIGQRRNANDPLNGWVKTFSYYPTQATSGDVQKLTQ